MIPIEFVIRNVGDEIVTFSGTAWRQLDHMHLRDAAGRPCERGTRWSSGIPKVRQYALHPGEQVTLESAALGIRGEGEDGHGHPVGYDAVAGPGRYRLFFSLAFPGVDGARAGEGDFIGELSTGVVDLLVR